MRFIKHLTTWLLLLTVITASGLVSAKVASGSQNLSSGLHQENITANALLHLAKIGISYDAASGSPVATKKLPDTLKPGPFAKESIPAHRGRPTAAEQRQVNDLMDKHGCHTCGTKNPGTKSGNAVADHQPAQALGEPKKFFPHCINCARRQGGQVRQQKRKGGN